jgi:hypothetical protein
MASLSERLEAAAVTLASSGTLKERLALAYSQHLSDLDAKDFPREFRDEFAELIETLHRERALPGDTVLKASLRKLSNDEAARFATLIIRTYGRIAALKTPPGLQALPRATAPLAIYLAAEAGSVGR